MQHIPLEAPVFGIHFPEDNYYKGSLPCFYNREDFPVARYVEQNWETMREEIIGFLNSGKVLEGSTSANSPGLSHPDAWKRMYFMNSMWLQPDNCRKLPKTWNILKQIPGVTLGAVLILDPHSCIHPHSSESNINIRCHVGIKIPGSLPECGIRVGTEEHNWKDGQVLMFSDCHEHTVWNNSSENRIIVAFDILHRQYDSNRRWLCSKYLGALTIRSLDAYVPFRKRIPAVLLNLMHWAISLVWFFYLLFQRLIFASLYSKSNR
jgi:aspartyl/asparaginyl beta-hydroxylase (cupin superfamily)